MRIKGAKVLALCAEAKFLYGISASVSTHDELTGFEIRLCLFSLVSNTGSTNSAVPFSVFCDV